MPVQLFLGPLIGTGTLDDPIRFKYLNIVNGTITDRSRDVKYIPEDITLIAVDATQTRLDEIAANLDVVTIPQDLDQTPSAALRQDITGILEDHNIPGNWIQQSVEVRETMRSTAWIMTLFGRVWSNTPEPRDSFFTGGVTLNTQWQNLPTATQNVLIAAAVYFNINLDPAPNELFRSILKNIADSQAGVPYNFDLITI